MSTEASIKAAFTVGIFCLISLFVLIYCLVVLFIPRFHNIHNTFIVNIYLSALFTSVYFIMFYTSLYVTGRNIFTLQACVMLFYMFNIAGIDIPFAFVAFSIHRYFSIVHHNNAIFKTKKWAAICIAAQWIGVCLLSLPFIFQKTNVSYKTTRPIKHVLDFLFVNNRFVRMSLG